MSNNDNITFFLEEKTDLDETDNQNSIQQMLNDLEGMYNNDDLNDFNEFTYYSIKQKYDNAYGINNENYYEQFTIKELFKICNYYDIEKHLKITKSKKPDIISSIVYFESLPENIAIVNKRHMLWACIMELLNDPKMKKFLIWT
jgi:hypothetical protein